MKPTPKSRAQPSSAVRVRCPWATNPLAVRYHDEEWGVPVHDDRVLFEFLLLEGAQAGLSWDTVLRKRANYASAFARFDASRVARYDERKIAALMNNSGIIRNRLKLAGAVENAKAFLRTREQFGSFDRYVWQQVGNEPRINRWRSQKEVPARTPASDALSKDLKLRGFRFVGGTICYAYMQAVGMVNDHLLSCFCHPDSARGRRRDHPDRDQSRR